jgi:hypothetical protein
MSLTRGIKIPINNRGLFKGKPHEVLKNKDGVYKIRIEEAAGYWRDVTWNDTAIAIAGRGNPDTRYFSSRSEVDGFIQKYWHGEPDYFESPKSPKVDQKWEPER